MGQKTINCIYFKRVQRRHIYLTFKKCVAILNVFTKQQFRYLFANLIILTDHYLDNARATMLKALPVLKDVHLVNLKKPFVSYQNVLSGQTGWVCRKTRLKTLHLRILARKRA